ncbi:transferase [Streptomyces sp. NBC_01217]|uniref:transferase n=1 Tax=Streptomyces sp. NBC_01217 TaxID=2903779 RepID=UPI002E0EC882|nr:transferase [Streptomyces sp. NBC_01217]
MTDSAERRTPRADCTAGPDGRITFDLGPGPDGRADGETPELLLRLRGAEGAGDGDTVRLPLSPLGEGRLRAVLPGTAAPAEGRWDVYVREPGADDEGAVAVEPGIRDVRHLMDRTPQTGRIAVRIPYPTVEGRLAVRCWVRSPHAEAGPVTFGRGGMTVEGALYGARLGDDARVEARLTGASDRVCRVPVTGKGGTFSFTLPFDRLAAGPVTGQQLWTLWLLPGTGNGMQADGMQADGKSADGKPTDGVRISRILDDVWDRRNSFVYPGRSAGEGARATPCYSTGNDLCVRLEPDPAQAG